MAEITEKIEFLTQVHTSRDGTEQRMAMRTKPRRYLSYSYVGMDAKQSQYLRMLTYGKQAELLYYPLWHAACPLTQSLYQSQATLKIPQDTLWGFYNIGALIIWQSDLVGGTKYDLSYITAEGTLGTAKQFKSDYLAYAVSVLPVCQGVLLQEGQYTNQTSEISGMTVNIELLANQNAPTFPASFGEAHDEKIEFDEQPDYGLPERYLGIEVFHREPPWPGDLGASSMRNFNRLDNETGVFRYDMKSTETTETKQIQYCTTSRAEINNLQRFFYRAKGMCKSFWMPTWLNDIELAGDAKAGQASLLTEYDAYWKYYAKSKRRNVAVIFYRNFTSELLKFAGYTVDETGKYGKIYLDTPLKKRIVKNEVLMISYICRCRFASDTLTTEYDTTGVATIDMQIAEVDE